MSNNEPVFQEILEAIQSSERRTLAVVENSKQEVLEVIQEFAGHVDQRFEKIDQRFEKVDQRFDQIDKRFAKVDQRFDQMDERFEKIDQRLQQHDLRFDKIDLRFEQIDQRMDDIVEAINVFASHTEERFTHMLTKEYLDERLGDLRSDLIMLSRKQNIKFQTLVHDLVDEGRLTKKAADKILSMEPFPA